MAMFKCKMCGGTLEFNPGDSVAICDSCGTQQTLPKLTDERRANLYDRANHFRRNNEFDKAEGIYEQILNDDATDAEAYWSLVLCKYGIEYVEDPVTHKRVPTVNRVQYEAVAANENYKRALEYADGAQRVVYEDEARAIDQIQKGILEISAKEEPFDVFICYKETDSTGRRTPDSVLANDLYHQLTQEGFRVFFARITLEDKLGSAYEPYIFAALNSAKVMVVLGTKPEYFSAVWVKNEWSRYMALIRGGAQKVLIPAYKGMDPYDLPEEFSHLQAQDMSKLGFMQDLIRGIKKIAAVPSATPTENAAPVQGSNVLTLMERAFMFLEDGEWDKADEYAEKVLDLNPKYGEAYLVKLMIDLQVKHRQDLKNCEQSFEQQVNYEKALRFGDEKLKAELHGAIAYIENRNHEDWLKNQYQTALTYMKQRHYLQAKGILEEIADYADAVARIEECNRCLAEIVEERKRQEAERRAAEERRRIERERQEEIRRKQMEAAKKRMIKIAIVAAVCLVVVVSATMIYQNVIYPSQEYQRAREAEFAKFTVGNIVTIGKYEQDNNTANGKEDVEWIVLDRQGDKALLISKYALDCKPYNKTYTSVTWETCTLRPWLNDTFLTTAFSTTEQACVETVKVTADKNPSESTNPGSDTQDKVFLLSINEVQKYFSSNSARVCQPTAYAKAQGAYTSSSGNCFWWLRSPGDRSDSAAGVNSAGSVIDYGDRVDRNRDSVRPALWLNLESLIP